MARDAGQHVDLSLGVERSEVEVARGQRQRGGGGQGEGRLAQFHRVDAQKQVMHDRIADEDGFHDEVGGNPALGGNLARQRVDGLAHRVGHLGIAARVHHRVGDAAHQVFTEADLRVHEARGGQNAPVGQVAQMRRNGGGPQVDRQPVNAAFVQAGPDVEDAKALRPLRLVQRHGDLPFALAQNGLQLAHQRQASGDILDLPLVLERAAQPLEIARGFVHVGFFDLDEDQPRCRVHDDGTVRGRLADHLAVDLALGRNVDDDVALHGGLAAEPAALLQAAHPVIAGLDRVPFRQRVLAHGHPVLGEVAIGRGHLALGADPPAAADGIEVDAQFAGRRQNRGSDRETAPFARGREDHQGMVRHARAFLLCGCFNARAGKGKERNGKIRPGCGMR